MLISAYLCINIFGSTHTKLVDEKGNWVTLKIGQKKLFTWKIKYIYLKRSKKETNNSNLDSFKQEILFKLSLGRWVFQAERKKERNAMKKM